MPEICTFASTLLAGRANVAIAHRLSTIRHAQLVLVIDAGRITLRGTHDELMARDGPYADLYRRQFRQPQGSGQLERAG